MHKRNAIIPAPLLAALVLSIAVHVAALYPGGGSAPPEPQLKIGRTVVQLTLLPAMASQAATPEPQRAEPLPVEIIPEPILESTPEPAPQTIEEATAVDSQEQNASPREDKGVITAAIVSGAVHPAYPRISQRRGETGIVKLAVQVLADGSVGTVVILQSSGFRRLDEAAVNGAKKTTFTPAQHFGRNQESTTELTFSFNLTDD